MIRYHSSLVLLTFCRLGHVGEKWIQFDSIFHWQTFWYYRYAGWDQSK